MLCQSLFLSGCHQVYHTARTTNRYIRGQYNFGYVHIPLVYMYVWILTGKSQTSDEREGGREKGGGGEGGGGGGGGGEEGSKRPSTSLPLLPLILSCLISLIKVVYVRTLHYLKYGHSSNNSLSGTYH